MNEAEEKKESEAECRTRENREYFIKALREAIESKKHEPELPKEFLLSDDDKRDLNYVARIYGCDKENIPYPEVDTRYERIKTKIISIFHVIGYFYRWKARRRKKMLKKTQDSDSFAH